jgi:hypothetical protein
VSITFASPEQEGAHAQKINKVYNMNNQLITKVYSQRGVRLLKNQRDTDQPSNKTFSGSEITSILKKGKRLAELETPINDNGL